MSLMAVDISLPVVCRWKKLNDCRSVRAYTSLRRSITTDWPSRCTLYSPRYSLKAFRA